MARSEEDYLRELWDKNICPNCGKDIPEGKRIGSGKRAEGGFCTLDCYTNYHQVALIERAKKLAALTERHRKS